MIEIIRFDTPQPYEGIYLKMRDFTHHRTPETPDQIWLLAHEAIYTQGQAGSNEHVRNLGAIPLFQSDRGGQITYHGPGQIMIYLLLNLTRRQFNIRDCLNLLENTIIELLASYQIPAYHKPEAPGIYIHSIREEKIASIGLRVRKGYSYHGLCFNVEGDLSPFAGINPCADPNVTMTHMQAQLPPHRKININTIYSQLTEILQNAL